MEPESRSLYEQLTAAVTELRTAEIKESTLLSEVRALTTEKVEAELSSAKLPKPKAVALEAARSEFNEIKTIVEARRKRVAELRTLSFDKERSAIQRKQQALVEQAVRESERGATILRQLQECRATIEALMDNDRNLIRSANCEFEKNGQPKLHTRIFQVWNLVPPAANQSADEWDRETQRYRTQVLAG